MSETETRGRPTLPAGQRVHDLPRVVVHVDRELLRAIDRAAKTAGVKRTRWILDVLARVSSGAEIL